MDEGILNEIAAAMQKVCENPDFRLRWPACSTAPSPPRRRIWRPPASSSATSGTSGQEIIDVAPGLDELT